MCSYFPPRTPDGCVVRPLARVRRYTSDPLCLPTLTQLLLTFDPDIVEKVGRCDPLCLPTLTQLLLTFDPDIVEKVATLLCEVLTDNPALSTVYTTGLFFFVLMYVGSNVLPVARLLHLCHLRQTFRPQEQLAGGDLLQQSILGPLLPEAMVCYLHNYGPDKFAEIFLGEFDTPEVMLLKKVLSAWREEVHKQPPSMSADAAYEELELTPGQRHADDVVRRAYLRLAARYHPDKNAGGR
ncbi:hypothetical protein HAZT_HAZT004013, partial [Hyalella azteca]